MIKLLDKILNNFRNCFTRQASFNWFVVIIIGLMLRSDILGLTSIIRDLGLAPKHYESILHFFHSSSWSLKSISSKWFEVVKNFAPLYYEGNSVVLIGDGVKQAKEARKMPGVKKLHQESENCSKAEYIFGHMFGGIGALSSTSSKFFCIPLLITLQDGVKDFFKWQVAEDEQAERQLSHVVQTVENAFKVAKVLGDTILLLDRYFLSTNALEKLRDLNEKTQCQMHIVTKAKISYKAYEYPPVKKNGRGRPAKKGADVKLQ
ncbi:MAG: transposase, partial [Cellulosilyticaceae bacterium]